MDPVFEQIKQIVSKDPTIKKVVLFGSRARGDDTERSDYDLAFFAEAGVDLSPLFSIIIDKNPTLKKFDLIHFEKVQPELQSKILSEGKVIYEIKKN